MASAKAQERQVNARHRKMKERMDALAAEFGASVVRIAIRGSGHFSVRFRIGLAERVVFTSFSPSDFRSAQNDRAFIRRTLRALSESPQAQLRLVA